MINKLIIFTLFLSGSAIGQVVKVEFSLPSQATQTVTLTNQETQHGAFWTQWIVETNDSPRECMDKFEHDVWVRGSGSFLLTNFLSGDMYYIHCTKDHLDTSTQTETKYVSSNLVSFLVWRGRTNVNYLESIPITNIVRHWHWDRTRIYTP
jgi:hypothetical protein